MLLKKLKESFDVNKLFSSKISNYKVHASIYKLFEHRKSLSPEEKTETHFNLVEHITTKNNSIKLSEAKSLPAVTNVKVMYGIYDIMVILESNDMGTIKKTIDADLHDLDGITNMTSLVTVGIAGAILE